MNTGLSVHYLRASVLYALAGMALGIHMAASHDHSQLPTHAHLMLFGWVGMTIYAVIYKLWPDAASGLLPKLHMVAAHLALIGLVAGLDLIYDGNIETGDPVAAIASIVLIANMALFAWIVWRKIR